MEEPIRNFLKSFHNLPGITVAEKKYSLKMLFHENSNQLMDAEFQEKITSDLKQSATTHLERIFFVDFLIFTRRIPDLISEFQKGNEIVVSKISKMIWFFADAYDKFGADEFVNELLPNLGYNIRLKVLNKISIVGNLEESKIDAIFDALHARYGLFVATHVLTGCSVPKIEQILKSQPVKLSLRQLKVLYKRRSPALIEIYIDERIRQEGDKFLNDYNNNVIFKFIAAESPEMFCNFQEKYRFRSCRLGKRTTRNVVKTQKARLLEKPDLFIDNLKPQTLVRKLNSDFLQFFAKVFPKIGDDENWLRNQSVLPFYSKNRRFELFLNTYNGTYHRKLKENISKCNSSLFNLIADPDEREKYAELKVESSDQVLSEFYKYYTPDNCYYFMTEKLKTANEQQKLQIVEILTENCIISKDLEAFLEVSRFICFQFWDEIKILGKFLQVIHPETYSYYYSLWHQPKNDILGDLSRSHWSKIKKLILRKEFRAEKLHVDPTRIFFKYLQFLMAENLPTRNEMINFFNSTNWTNSLSDLNNPKVCSPSAQKLILLNFTEIAPLILSPDETIEEVDCKLLLAIKQFNEKNKKNNNKIDVFQLNQRMFSSLQKAAETHQETPVLEPPALGDILEWLICRTNSLSHPQISALSQLYWKNFETLSNVQALTWFLKYDPQTVSDNISVILNRFLQPYRHNSHIPYNYLSNRTLWNSLKCYSHLELDTKTIAFFVSKLSDDSIEDKKDLLRPLVHLMPPADFLELAETFIPTEFTVDLLHAYTNNEFQFQRTLLQNLKHVKLGHDEAFGLIMKFYCGDYVRSCLCPLNSVVCRIPENELGPKLEQICALKPVSARKHGYFYFCSLCDQETVFERMQKCTLSQAIASCFNFFRRNPSERSWKALAAKLPKLDNNDGFSALLLVNAPVPVEYKSKFLELAYTVMDKQGNKFRTVLLDKTQKNTVRGLSIGFCQEFLAPSFLLSEKINRIFAFLLLSGQQRHFDLVCDNLKKFKADKWKLREFQQRHVFSNFIQTFFDLYMRSKETNTDLIDMFLQRVASIFRPEEIFEEYVLVNLMKLKQCNNSADFARELIKLNNFLVERGGQTVIEVVAGVVNKNFNSFATNSSTNLHEVCFHAINMKQSVNDVLLVMQLLPKDKPPCFEQEFQLYRTTLTSLNDVDDDAVKLYFDFFFDKIKITVFEEPVSV